MRESWSKEDTIAYLFYGFMAIAGLAIGALLSAGGVACS